MTCAACATRVQRKLERGEGVAEAAVNFGTERATVRFDPASATTAGLVELVRSAGYGARTDEVVLPMRAWNGRPAVSRWSVSSGRCAAWSGRM
jgi:cation transport ATPase